MTIYHRHLDHDWQAARRETNYALFGNARGDTVATNSNWCSPIATKEQRRAEWWRIKYCMAVTGFSSMKHKAGARAASVAWLRYKELEA